MRLSIITILSSCIGGCASLPPVPSEITGTISSRFELFSFEPIGATDSHWINTQSGKAQGWHLFNKIHDSQREAHGKYTIPMPLIQVCITGTSVINKHPNGVGHLGLWKSDITFTEITSVKNGECNQ